MPTNHSLRQIGRRTQRGAAGPSRFPRFSGAWLGLALAAGACDGGYYTDGYYYDDPYYYYYYAPYYDDWTFWGDDAGWWYPFTGQELPFAASPQTVQPTTGIDELKELKAQLAGINASVVNLMSPIAELIKQAPRSPQKGVREYEPTNLPLGQPAATFRFTISKIHDRKYGWRLTAKPIGADDSQYQVVLEGNLANLVQAHHGSGQARFMLDNLHAVNSTAYPGTGQISATTTSGGARLARLVNFSPDGKLPPVTAVYAVERTTDGVRHLWWRRNSERVAGMPDKGPEKVIEYLNWLPDKGGRIYTIIKNGKDAQRMPQGDLPTDTYLLGQSCYAQGGTMLYKAWTSCAGTQPAQCLESPPTLLETPGKTVSDCVAGTAGLPPSAALAATADAQDTGATANRESAE